MVSVLAVIFVIPSCLNAQTMPRHRPDTNPTQDKFSRHTAVKPTTIMAT